MFIDKAVDHDQPAWIDAKSEFHFFTLLFVPSFMWMSSPHITMYHWYAEVRWPLSLDQSIPVSAFAFILFLHSLCLFCCVHPLSRQSLYSPASVYQLCF